MTFREMLADLLDQANAGPPTAEALVARYRPSARAITTAGPQLVRPSWSTRVTGAGDVFLELDGDLAGLQLYEDGRGWGAYAELWVKQGTLADAEAVIGPTRPVPRAPGAFTSGDKVSAYLPRGGKTVRVFVELRTPGPAVQVVTVHFQR